jgi:hypothetical protein
MILSVRAKIKNKGGRQMRIELSKTTVEFTPEADYEKTMLEGLWRMLVDCARFNQKLVPVGEYVPAKNNPSMGMCGGWDDGILRSPWHRPPNHRLHFPSRLK